MVIILLFTVLINSWFIFRSSFASCWWGAIIWLFAKDTFGNTRDLAACIICAKVPRDNCIHTNNPGMHKSLYLLCIMDCIASTTAYNLKDGVKSAAKVKTCIGKLILLFIMMFIWLFVIWCQHSVWLSHLADPIYKILFQKFVSLILYIYIYIYIYILLTKN